MRKAKKNNIEFSQKLVSYINWSEEIVRTLEVCNGNSQEMRFIFHYSCQISTNFNCCILIGRISVFVCVTLNTRELIVYRHLFSFLQNTFAIHPHRLPVSLCLYCKLETHFNFLFSHKLFLELNIYFLRKAFRSLCSCLVNLRGNYV